MLHLQLVVWSCCTPFVYREDWKNRRSNKKPPQVRFLLAVALWVWFVFKKSLCCVCQKNLSFYHIPYHRVWPSWEFLTHDLFCLTERLTALRLTENSNSLPKSLYPALGFSLFWSSLVIRFFASRTITSYYTEDRKPGNSYASPSATKRVK